MKVAFLALSIFLCCCLVTVQMRPNQKSTDPPTKTQNVTESPKDPTDNQPGKSTQSEVKTTKKPADPPTKAQNVTESPKDPTDSQPGKSTQSEVKTTKKPADPPTKAQNVTESPKDPTDSQPGNSTQSEVNTTKKPADPPTKAQNVTESPKDPTDNQPGKSAQSEVDASKEPGGNASEDMTENQEHSNEIVEEESGHFFAYLVSTAVLVAVLYIAHHNKRKIIAFVLEGKKTRSTRRPKSSDYQKLEQHL
ncbi:trans-Golgi network integral membrane protein 1 [Melanotaenia boesemani]|uniref:trans-Golgi network integral membrane protein 1 n=1 Tax=Melanotaenia boesemani TaxID=1250792 RepID=UPI001C05242D|nr:trans-Golgi network integral membrane protein 1 [Melanotaenia boesemani]